MMNKIEGEPQSQWLKKVEADQNVKGINQLDDTLKNDEGRHWFDSQEVKPILHMGTYNPTTGRYMLGSTSDGRSIITDTQVDTTSLAADTLTVPAGYVYRLRLVATRNSNRATRVTLSYTPNGGTETFLTGPTGLYPQLYYANVFGGAYSGAVAASTSGSTSELWMQAGDVVTVTQGDFVAADVVRHEFVFEIYQLAF